MMMLKDPPYVVLATSLCDDKNENDMIVGCDDALTQESSMVVLYSPGFGPFRYGHPS
jgi:hypothetical protein